MIVNQLYENSTSYWTGETMHQYQDFLSQAAWQVDSSLTSFSPDAYWLGWISSENLPIANHFSHCEINDTTYKFVDDTDNANFPITYATGFTVYGNVYENGSIIKDNNNRSNYENLKFWNQMYPEYAASYDNGTNLQVYGRLYFYNAGGQFVTRGVFNHSLMITSPENIFTDFKNFIRFCEEGGTITISTQNYGIFTFTKEDFENGTFYVETSTGYFVRGFIVSYSVPHKYYIYHYNEVSADITGLFPFVSVTCSNNDVISSYSTPIRGIGYSDSIAILENGNFTWRFDNATTSSRPMGKIRTGMNGTIETSVLDSTHPIQWDGSVLAEFNNGVVNFFCICSLNDIYKTFALAFRVDTQEYTMSYVNNVTYATDVTSSNEFLAKLKTGNIGTPKFKNTLRTWQYENFQEDKFKEDDVPTGDIKPDADKPDVEGDQENGGDDIEPNDATGIGGGFGFLTQYALRAADIEVLGKLLWKGFTTGTQQDIDQYLLNFKYYVNPDTGSVNFSDIMDFFVSLRVYPFPLSGITTLTECGRHMYIGAGTTAIGDDPNLPHFANILHTMDSFNATIDAGYREIPFWFRDYRDYSLQASIYLPYCGTAELDPADILGGKVSCFYEVDFCTGACCAYVYVNTWDNKKFPLVQMSGQVGADVPMTATNAGRVASRIHNDRINTAENLYSILTGGLGIVDSVAGLNADKVSVRDGLGVLGTMSNALMTPEFQNQRLLANIAERGAIKAPCLGTGGGFSNFRSEKTVYIQIRSPFYPEVDIYDESLGYPSADSVTLSNCTGFCIFANVKVSGINCTDEEKSAIKALLETGVYL